MESAAKPDINISSSLVLLRGPALIAIGSSWALCLFLRTLSWFSFAQLGLLFFGFALLVVDARRVGERQCRAIIQRWLDSVVWDDALILFFKPAFSWYGLFTETILGQAMWMYSLPATASQRVTLTQASLGVDEQTANRILFEPGGFKQELFPKSFLRWLDGDTTTETKDSEDHSSSDSEEPKSEEPAAEDQNDSEPKNLSTEEGFQIVTKPGQLTSDPQKQSSNEIVESSTISNNVSRDYVLLSKTIQSILRKTLMEHLHQMLKFGNQESKIVAAVGLAATVSLAIQLRISSRARKIAIFLLEMASLAGLSSVIMGALTLLTALPSDANNGTRETRAAILKQVITLIPRMSGVNGRQRGVGISSLGLLAFAAWKRKQRVKNGSNRR
ncbi:expressed unknown protein [Seminavis robusta]|uniref:Uncharacterized protein n=1 Tax=Seminavis robusta TaxID=568900 RepID=A0A9N8DC04_9STRA|nr:expressed unknown protein [Seminavis robusta]|eukprot:Sro78_g042580.1 n/a (387) ;mRNA; r:107533-108693